MQTLSFSIQYMGEGGASTRPLSNLNLTPAGSYARKDCDYDNGFDVDYDNGYDHDHDYDYDNMVTGDQTTGASLLSCR